MAAALLSTILAILLALPAEGWAAGPLEERLEHWPQWSLPAPLPRPGRGDLIYPSWFEGHWSVSDPGNEPPLVWEARFRPDGRGGIVGERAANAAAVGRALLGRRCWPWRRTRPIRTVSWRGCGTGYCWSRG